MKESGIIVLKGIVTIIVFQKVNDYMSIVEFNCCILGDVTEDALWTAWVRKFYIVY